MPSSLRLVESTASPEGRVVQGARAAEASPVTDSEAPPPSNTYSSSPGSSRMGEEREDAELVALARAGESSAFERLYRRYSRYAMSLAVRVQGNPGDVEDIVHDAFLKVHDRLDDLRDGSSFRPWLGSVVVSLVRTRLRRRRMLGLLGLSTSEPIDLDALAAPDAGPEVRAQLAQVYRILREASVDQSICWTLRYIEGRKLEDVAQMADCSLATAKRRIAAVQQRILLAEASSKSGANFDDAPEEVREAPETSEQ